MSQSSSQNSERKLNQENVQVYESNPYQTKSLGNEEFLIQRKSNYADLLGSDIKDPFLRAAFDGDDFHLMQAYKFYISRNLISQLINEEDNEFENQFDKYLLGFFLAMQNSQIKTANIFLRKYEELRLIISRICHYYDYEIRYSQKKMKKSPSSKYKKVKAEIGLFSPLGSDEDPFKQHQEKQADKQPLVKFDKQRKRPYSVKEQSITNHPGMSSLEDDNENQNNSDQFENKSKSNSRSGRGKLTMEQVNEAENYDSLNDEVIKIQSIQFLSEVTRFKKILASEYGIQLNTNVLKVALNFQEDKVAAFIVARYPITIDDGIILTAINNKCLLFILNLFQFNKNEYVVNSMDTQDGSLDYQKRVLTIENVILKINELFHQNQAEELLTQVMSWRIKTETNLLQVLLNLGHERVASNFMKFYPQYSTFQFFSKAMKQEHQSFVKYSLRDQYFDLNFMKEEKIVKWILDKIISGQTILYPLNLLLYADFKKWNHQQISQIIRIATQIITPNLETNYMLITPNPIMTLGLMIQYLQQIKKYFNVFDTDCTKLIARIEVLGKLIIQDMKFDVVEDIFMDKDFLERTVLNIITDNKIMSFIVINKLRFLIDKIWDGKDSGVIDGKISHFSKTEYLMYHEIKRLKGVKVSLNDIVGNNFKTNIEDYNFIFQLKFRQQSIMIIFVKDFICATFIVIVFQYINYLYLNNFTERRYSFLSEYDQQLQVIKTNLDQYKSINFMGTILSVSYFLNFLYRMVYNAFSQRKIYMDIWMIFDLVAGTVNIAAFNLIGNSSPESMLTTSSKRFYDYYMICVLIISWLRFFSYFLVINNISKVTLTLFMMLRETLYFLFVLCCYFMLMTTVFATLFRDCPTEDAQDYKTIFSTIRQLIDYFFANYQTVKDMGNYNTSHSVLVILHLVISNVFLLNFLVAILQTVYDIMIKNGDFYAIEYQYQFITKYMKAIEEKNGYEKFILYPPPLNFIILPMLFLTPSRTWIKKASEFYTYLTFWMENVFLIILFILYLLALDPFILIKTYFQIITKIDGICYKILSFLGWTFLGIFFLLYVNLYDTCMLINVFCLQNSVELDQTEEEKSKYLYFKYQIYQDIIKSLNLLHQIADNSTGLFNKRQNLMREFTHSQTLKQKIKTSENEMKIDDLYIIRNELALAVYEQLSMQNPYLLSYRQASSLHSGSRRNFNIIPPQMNENNMKDKPQANISLELRNLISGLIIQAKNRDNIEDVRSFMSKEKNKPGYSCPCEEELKILNSFMYRFSIMQKNSETQTINLVLVLKTIPKAFNKHHVRKIEFMNFNRMQKTLITFFNDDQDEMFNYYDNRMIRRFVSLKRSSTRNYRILDNILNHVKGVIDYLSWEEKAHQIVKKETMRSKKTMMSELRPDSYLGAQRDAGFQSEYMNSDTESASLKQSQHQNNRYKNAEINIFHAKLDNETPRTKRSNKDDRLPSSRSQDGLDSTRSNMRTFDIDRVMQQEQQKNMERVKSYKRMKEKQEKKKAFTNSTFNPTTTQKSPTYLSVNDSNLPKIGGNPVFAQSLAVPKGSTSEAAYRVVQHQFQQTQNPSRFTNLKTMVHPFLPKFEIGIAEQFLKIIRKKRQEKKKKTLLNNSDEISKDDIDQTDLSFEENTRRRILKQGEDKKVKEVESSFTSDDISDQDQDY